jgi:CBS domain-containing protein
MMLAERTTAVPVVDEHMVLIGMVTDRDLVRVLAGDA